MSQHLVSWPSVSSKWTSETSVPKTTSMYIYLMSMSLTYVISI